MSLKDRISSKLGKSKEALPFNTFDETTIHISALGGRSQLCPVKLNCQWVHAGVQARPPELSCKWYNKTETSLNVIDGVTGSYYQPNLSDVGSIIHIQCVPELQGVEYEGMPVIKDIGPIKADPETEEEANDFLEAGKATFFIKIKEIHDQSSKEQIEHEGLIKMNKMNLRLISRFHEQQKQVLSIQMNQLYPDLILHRVNVKEIKIIYRQQKYVILDFSNNKVRDVFYLLTKFVVAKAQKVEEEIVKHTQIKQQHSLMQKSESLLHQSTNPKQQIKQIKSSEELKTNPGNTRQDSRQSVSDFMQITELKKQVRKLEGDKFQLNKVINEKQENILELKEKLSLAQQRQTNLNKNYFELEDRLNNSFDSHGKLHQELSFYRNQYRLLKEENEQQKKKVGKLVKKNNELEKELESFRQDEAESYEELKQKYGQEKKIRESLQKGYENVKQESKTMEQELKNLQEKLNELENERKYFQKKYQAISEQFTFSNGMSKSIIKQKSFKSMESNDSDDYIRMKMESQILELKKQLKNIVEQNNYIRTLGVKQKKPSSKSQLKSELIEMRKVANRLAETVTEKDLELDQMKKINRELNERLLDLSKFNYQNEELMKSSSVRE